MPELYFSLDIETDGPIPGVNSMRSLGMAAFLDTGERCGAFRANLEPWLGAEVDPDTYAWWQETPEKRQKYLELDIDAEPPMKVMEDVDSWIRNLSSFQNRQAVCLASPAGYDFVFYRWYAIALLKRETPFKHRCLDLRSYTMAMFGLDYLESGKESIPEHLVPSEQHTHNAYEDALEQGVLFMNLKAENRRRLALVEPKAFLVK